MAVAHAAAAWKRVQMRDSVDSSYAIEVNGVGVGPRSSGTEASVDVRLCGLPLEQ